MGKNAQAAALTRRAMLKAGGALVISIGMPIGVDAVLNIRTALAQGTKPPLVPDQLSSYVAINSDGSVSAFLGKTDMGQGLFVAIGQMVAEELDVPFNAVTVIMGDTATTVNQGGASGSTGIWKGGAALRNAAENGQGIVVMPEFAAAPSLAAGRLVFASRDDAAHGGRHLPHDDPPAAEEGARASGLAQGPQEG